ncbi:unnamed protein product [Caenorhabditis sp. 36 PRJEB53466]|nr:unnamed protein product [Caenorhabditis sp. 36 PRJEB53466]
MKDFVKKEEPAFEEEDAHVLNDDVPAGPLPELPQILALAEGAGKIGRARRGRVKEEKLHIRQNDDVIVLDEEDMKKEAPSPPPPPKPTPSNILDQIMFAQEKEFGVVNPNVNASKSKTLPNGRRSVW